MNKNFLWAAIGIVPMVIFWFVAGPIPQPLAYHDFADKRDLCGCIPNTFDVLSNVPFIFTTIFGLIFLQKNKEDYKETYKYYLIFFISVTFVGLGSSYYHWSPNSQTLVWDRAPMTGAFIALFSTCRAGFCFFGKKTFLASVYRRFSQRCLLALYR